MFNLIPVPIVFGLDRIHCYHLGGRELVFIWLTVGLWCLMPLSTILSFHIHLQKLLLLS
jgi:hypothetical protein